MPNPFERGPEKDPHERWPCPDCGRSGQKDGKKCKRCDGKGWILTQKC